jgi:hypothetical protein
MRSLIYDWAWAAQLILQEACNIFRACACEPASNANDIIEPAIIKRGRALDGVNARLMSGAPQGSIRR